MSVDHRAEAEKRLAWAAGNTEPEWAMVNATIGLAHATLAAAARPASATAPGIDLDDQPIPRTVVDYIELRDAVCEYLAALDGPIHREADLRIRLRNLVGDPPR